MLTANGTKLFFYSRVDEKKNDETIELDFLVRIDGKISPVEGEVGHKIQYFSLDKFRKKFSETI